MMNQNNSKEILNTCIKNDFRAEEMKTVLNNRISLCKRLLTSQFSLDEIAETKTRIRTYEDCIEILNKEFFELSILDEICIEEYIKKIRDKIVNKLCPVGDHNRGTQDYIRNLKQANMIAEIIEALCYQMVNYGYNLKPKSVRNTDS